VRSDTPLEPVMVMRDAAGLIAFETRVQAAWRARRLRTSAASTTAAVLSRIWRLITACPWLSIAMPLLLSSVRNSA